MSRHIERPDATSLADHEAALERIQRRIDGKDAAREMLASLAASDIEDKTFMGAFVERVREAAELQQENLRTRTQLCIATTELAEMRSVAEGMRERGHEHITCRFIADWMTATLRGIEEVT